MNAAKYIFTESTRNELIKLGWDGNELPLVTIIQDAFRRFEAQDPAIWGSMTYVGGFDIVSPDGKNFIKVWVTPEMSLTERGWLCEAVTDFTAGIVLPNGDTCELFTTTRRRPL